MKASSVLYWIYAITKRNFGSQVAIKRSNVRFYKVNQYDVELFAKGGLQLSQVTATIVGVLEAAGYQHNRSMGSWDKKTTTHSIHVYVQTGKGMDGNDFLNVHPAVYKL